MSGSPKGPSPVNTWDGSSVPSCSSCLPLLIHRPQVLPYFTVLYNLLIATLLVNALENTGVGQGQSYTAASVFWKQACRCYWNRAEAKKQKEKKIKKKKSRHWEIKHTQIWQVFHCDYTWFKFLTASSFCMKAQGVPPHPISLSWANSFLTSLSFLIDHKAEGTIGLNIQFGQNIRTFPQRVSWGLTKWGRRLGCFDVESVAGLCFDWSL